jgi:hypothetical protein
MALEIGDNTWIVDSGASTHVTRNAKILDEVREPIDQYNMKTTNGQTHVVRGQGGVSFRFLDGEIKKINNVLYIFGLTRNLLSIRTMIDVRFVAVFDFQRCLLFTKGNSSKIVARGARDQISSLYKLTNSCFQCRAKLG